MSGILSAVAGGSSQLRVVLAPSPAPFSPTIANGTDIVAGTATANVYGGTPPYTYAWTDNMANVSFSAASSASTNVLATGTDVEHNGTITCTVTDGIGTVLAPDFASFIAQGSPP